MEGWAAMKWAKTEWIWVASSLFDEEKGGRLAHRRSREGERERGASVPSRRDDDGANLALA